MTAVVMSFIRSGLFFLLVALFSFYLAFTGYRVLSRKTPLQRTGKRDWAAACMMVFGGVTLVAYGIYQILTSSYLVWTGYYRKRFSGTRAADRNVQRSTSNSESVREQASNSERICVNLRNLRTKTILPCVDRLS